MRRQVFSGMPLGDDSYSQGVRDGCQNTTSALGAATFRMKGNKIDGYRLSSDVMYLRGFQDGTSFCTFRLDWETH